MPHHKNAHQRAFEAKQYAVLSAINAHGRLAPAVLAQRELLERQMTLNAQRRALSQNPTGPGPLRRWIGARVLALGTRLTGAQITLEPSTGRTDDPFPTHSLS